MMLDTGNIHGDPATRSPAAGNADSWTSVLPLLNPKQVVARSISLEPRPHREGPAEEDSPMIAALYERHVCMEKMLSALAEIRGDQAPDIAG